MHSSLNHHPCFKDSKQDYGLRAECTLLEPWHSRLRQTWKISICIIQWFPSFTPLFTNGNRLSSIPMLTHILTFSFPPPPPNLSSLTCAPHFSNLCHSQNTHVQTIYSCTDHLPVYRPSTRVQTIYPCTDHLPVYRPSTRVQTSTCVQTVYPCTDRLPVYRPSTRVQTIYPCTDHLPVYRPSTRVQTVYPCTDRLPV